ncbi:CgeB family protein [Alkalihalobacillus hemicellulosilyticus]|uniref:Spore protein YkvP/CgeB glycosyl transferase-like domain-containing protein n=1 Tax=Halalkalibacter hemicellulosilyticusJCM 9152 TaxID=1236971 RepID=W4QFU8_9BACI|nr:glycosyltransferase [Halalkalibacter hemicellulosilyticus]GAE30936.1 hypothetical protein JCM9152_2369 [Halalkalibacter hemicellulosilyticusJCM 9152]
MKVYYVHSGFQQIYAYLDQAIVHSLNELGLSKQTNAYNEVDLLNDCLIDPPDLILTLLGSNLSTHTIETLNRKRIPMAVWLTEDPYYIDHTVKQIFQFDYVFTIDSAAKKVYEDAGHSNVYFLPLGTDPSVYYPTNKISNNQYDLMLIGYPYLNRVRLIQKILASLKVSCLVVGKNWSKYLTENKHLSLTILDQWISPIKVNQLLQSASIHLNPHRPTQLKQNKNRLKINSNSMNNRTFDLACAQQFQLIEHKDDLSDHFTLNKEIVSYHTTNALLQKISYYLQHGQERMEIAKNARKRVLTDHTIQCRLKQMITLVMQPQRKSLNNEA